MGGEGERREVANIIAACFLIPFGIWLTFAAGSGAGALLASIHHSGMGGLRVPMLVVAVAAACTGLIAIYLGIRMARGVRAADGDGAHSSRHGRDASMSDRPGPTTEAVPKAAAPSGGQVLAGFLLILFGVCLFLVGGGCTILWVTILLSSSGLNGSEGPGLVQISLVAAASGIAAIWQGLKMLRWTKAGAAEALASDKPPKRT